MAYVVRHMSEFGMSIPSKHGLLNSKKIGKLDLWELISRPFPNFLPKVAYSSFILLCRYESGLLHLGTSCRELARNSQPVRNKNRENTRQRKTITRTRQYLRGSAICLRPRSYRNFTIIKEKIQNAATVFLLSRKLQQPNPNNQNTFSTSCAQNSQWAINGPWIRPPLYGLSFKKSPIKNHATLFGSSQVVNQIKHN